MEQFEEFNKSCEEVEDRDFNLAQENVIEWVRDSETATVTFTQRRYITKIKRLAEKYPDKVKITAENKDGSIVAHVPTRAIKINIIERGELTEEEIERLKDNLAKTRGNKREPLLFE